jgi:heme exporter protein D
MDLGPNAVFVWASYVAVSIVIAAVLVWLFADGRRQQRKLDAFEARGITRRSAASRE